MHLLVKGLCLFVLCGVERLDRRETHCLSLEQTFQMFAGVDQSMRDHRAVCIDQYAVGQLADLVRQADFPGQQIRRCASMND